MDDVKIGRARGYDGLGEWLVGPECHDLIRTRTNEAQSLYRSRVARRTGKLSRSARVSVSVETLGKQGPQWVGRLQVEAPYAAAYEFGRDYESVLRGRSPRRGARDLEATLRALGR